MAADFGEARDLDAMCGERLAQRWPAASRRGAASKAACAVRRLGDKFRAAGAQRRLETVPPSRQRRGIKHDSRARRRPRPAWR